MSIRQNLEDVKILTSQVERHPKCKELRLDNGRYELTMFTRRGGSALVHVPTGYKAQQLRGLLTELQRS